MNQKFFLNCKKIVFASALILAISLSVAAKDTSQNLSPIYPANNPDLKMKVEQKDKKERKNPLQAAINFYEKSRILQTSLAERGIIFSLDYTNDTGFNLGGVKQSRTGVKSISLLDMFLNLDTEKLGWWRSGNFFFHGQEIHGHSLSSHRVGDLQVLSNIEAPDRIQLSEFGYEQSLFNDRIDAIIGKQDANAVFDLLECAGDFVNSSFGIIPNIPVPIYPDQGIGAVTVIKPVSWFNVKAGVFDGDSKGNHLGFKSTFDGQNGIVTIVESGITPTIKGNNGNYFIGYWLHSAGADEIYSNNPASYGDNYGIYTSFEQELFKKHNSDQGFSILGQFGWAPSDRNEIARYYGTGLVYTGLFPKRNNDITGIGLALVDLSKRYKRSESVKNEAAIELYHKFQINDTLALQPDVQIIVNADGSRKTAIVIGLRSIISLAPRVPEEL